MARVECWRADILESVHPFSAVVARGDDVLGRIGPAWHTTMRSAAKPFQLTTSLDVLGADRADTSGVSSDELAIGTASHSAELAHLARVRAVMQRYGVTESMLRCGAHAPVHTASADAVLRQGGQFTDIHNNCSGKHTFMVAACLSQGWPMDYRPATHPLQRRILGQITTLAGEGPRLGVDGCGVPTFGLSLVAMTRAWSALARAMVEAPRSNLGRVGAALAAEPYLVSGTDRLEPALLAIAREPIAAKIGAEGLFCMALPHRRVGMVVKIHSGHSDALAVAVLHALVTLIPGAIEPPQAWPWAEVANVVGRVVGRRVVG